MERIHFFTALISCIKVYAQVVQPMKHPGLQVLATASHYWPLDAVDGIHELWDKIGNRPGYVNGSNITLRIHNHTVLPSSHNSSYVYTNDSTYTNISATVDIVEGMVNKGIFLNGDNGGTFLHFGNYQNSCISDPTLCGPDGITFSFFWKNHELESRFAVASGGKVISNGFSVYTNPFGGYVEFYTRGNNHRWKANIEVPGPYWTHILFTWKKTEGLKVYINGTYTAGDAVGSVSNNYGDPYPDLVIGTGNGKTYGHYVTGAFDEFVIWERALSPNNISLYYNAAIGQAIVSATTPIVSKEIISTTPTITTTEMSRPVVSSQHTGGKTFQDQESSRLFGFLHTLPNRTIPHHTAVNLTQAFLKSVEEVLSSAGFPEQSIPVVSGLIKTVDGVMEHMVTNLEHSPNSPITLGGTSFVADYCLVKVPQHYILPHYRFPTQGKNYISVPGEAFTMKSQTNIVGLFYHNMHNYYKEISPVKTRINEAADFKNHKIQVASNLISLKVEPSPALSYNLSGTPLIEIVLTHVLTQEQQDRIQNQSNKVFLYCAFLNYSSNEAVWSNEGCVRSDGNMSYSVCLCNHLTNFAILMQVVPIELTTGHQVALSAIGYVGCSISIFCLAITLVTFAVLSSVSTIRNQRYHIHANLSFAILVAEMLLLISARFDPGTLPCKVMAILLHFFFLSTFAWMLVEGLHLYSMVVKVFGSEGSKHFYYYGIGWGSPLVICVVSITSALDSYGKIDNCWLSLKNGAIWAFVAPALFVIVVNIGILISVTRIISRISGENYKVHGDANAVKLTAKAVAVLLPILGISWIFGVLAVNMNTLPFLYIFAVFNSLQGFFVFLFHCLLNSEVRAAFKHKTKVWSLTSSSIRNINVKPFNSDIMNGNKEGVTPTKMNTWDKSTNSANRIDLSAV
ncbi:Adhesion G-protein coupled receptor D1 G-protein coupled receptor 133 Precursor [Channa argus]|uniref:Adhesion G-protein coupled receptor D1 G-protein coupled receptor 133 n=2 Tax=Channa argus TaxID=215402 RepID=A0A6G1Q0Z1_CHAAH|nr:Adhesion G-protein coupled receptor D1 G-protein coupled receptor 133 Precursor [Channa argus]